jgi:3-phenylpropionate/trans-cinnamate dioxygenase ferredoxin component
MAEFVTVGKADEIAEGDAKAFMIEDVAIAIARSDGQLYAFSDICTHQQCNLSVGSEIDGSTIQCECHGSTFDMGTGAVVQGPAVDPIETYPVSDEDGELRIEV